MSWLRAWRLPFRLARRDVRRRPGRSLLVTLLVALPVTALSLLAIGYRTTLRDDDAWIAHQFGTADAVVSLGLDCECDRRTPLESELPTGSSIVWGTEGFLPVRVAGEDESQEALVTTIDMSSPSLKGVRELWQGRWAANDGEVALDRDLADGFGVAIGDQLQLAHQQAAFEVVGLIKVGRDEYLPMIAAPGFDFAVIRPFFKTDDGFIELADSYDGSLGFQIDLSPDGSFPPETSDDRWKTTLLWLGGVLAMSVFGVVIAAAFAVSGRRQLTELGQLSASGVDRRTIVRALTMEGTVIGAVGAGLGFAAAAAIHSRSPNMFGLHSPAVVSIIDMVVVFVTAVVIATVAALVPARSLGSVSVMTAMAGRRPVGPVSRSRALRGALLVVGGLIVTVLAMRLEDGLALVLLPALGMIAVLIGVCALSALLIEKLTDLAARGGGAMRLSARSVGRSGPRAASVFASLLLVGMAVTGVSALTEYGAKGGFWEDRADRGDLFWVTSTRGTVDPSSGAWIFTPSTLPSSAATRQQAQDVVGKVVWTSVAAAYSSGSQWLIASDDLLDLLDISAEHRAIIDSSPDGVEFVRVSGRLASDAKRPVVVEPQMAFGFSWSVISVDAADDLGLSIVPSAVEFGVAGSELDHDEIEALQTLSRSDLDGLFYSDSEPIGEVVTWQVARGAETQSQLQANRMRIGVIVGALLLVGLLALIGMSLMSVEGRSERDLLVAVGVGPATVARIAGWRAGGLTFAAMAIAVPVGLAIGWLIYSTANQSIDVPWLLVELLIFALPVTAGCVAWVSSALAQRLRPLHGDSLAAD